MRDVSPPLCLSHGLAVYNSKKTIIVTEFVKIDPNHTGTEIDFVAEHYSLTLALTRNA